MIFQVVAIKQGRNNLRLSYLITIKLSSYKKQEFFKKHSHLYLSKSLSNSTIFDTASFERTLKRRRITKAIKRG